ncbi:hypothetical protein ABK040_016880 [Willaertia magna]
MGESEHLIINGNNSQIGGSSITKIITSLAVLIIILTFIISMVTLVLIGINYISLNVNNNSGGITTNNNYKSIKLNAGQRLNKGAAVTSCSDNFPEKKSVCLFQKFTDRSSILTKNSNYLYNYNDYKVIDTVQDLSNYKVKAYVQHVSNGNQVSQSLVFYALLSLDPIVAYESFALDLTVDPFEKPLQPGEFYQLLQVKLFSDDSFQSLYTARFVVSYVRVTDGGKQYSSIIATKNVIVTLTYDTSQMKVITFSRSVTAVGPQYATNVNADLTKEIIDKDKVALGYTKIRYTDFSFALTYERVGRCNVDTFQYVNSQLTFLQNQNSVLTCGKGLKSFYYNENTFLLMDMNNLMSVSIDPTNGNVAQNAVEKVMLNYNPILLSVNTKVMYIGMQHSSNHTTIQSQREYVGVYFNTDTNYASVMKILFDGTKFTTNRIVSLQKPMKNLQISLLSDNNFYQLTYEREGLIKTCIMTFEEETPSDYTYFVPSLGVEFTVGTISPQVTNLIVSDYCALLSDNCFNLIQRKDNTVFDIAAFDIPSNSFPILGVALNDADFGMEVEVAFSGIVDIYSNLKTGKKYYALEYYSSKSNLLEGGLTVSGTFGDYEADFVGVAISDKQLLLRNLEDKR